MKLNVTNVCVIIIAQCMYVSVSPSLRYIKTKITFLVPKSCIQYVVLLNYYVVLAGELY